MTLLITTLSRAQQVILLFRGALALVTVGHKSVAGMVWKSQCGSSHPPGLGKDPRRAELPRAPLHVSWKALRMISP